MTCLNEPRVANADYDQANNMVEGDPPLVRLFNEHLIQEPTVGFYLDRNWRAENSESPTYVASLVATLI